MNCDCTGNKTINVTQQLVLSLFSGVGLLDKAFRDAGFCVVSAGDLITGQDVRDFTGVKNKFDGIIGGSPCQDFSKANRDRPALKDSYSFEMIKQYERIVKECDPTWFLLENVSGVPNVKIESYNHQRIDINQSWYENINRLRHIQFGHKEDLTIQIERCVTNRVQKIEGCALASDGRTFKELVRLQGLPFGYDLPSFNVQGKKRAVGNGVPLVMGKVIAQAVRSVIEQNSNVTLQHQSTPAKCDNLNVTEQDKKERHKYTLPKDYEHMGFYVEERKCGCGCGRVVTGRKIYYDYSCRKRAQRKRDLAAL